MTKTKTKNTTKKKCNYCRGLGYIKLGTNEYAVEGTETCPDCKGSGEIEK